MDKLKIELIENLAIQDYLLARGNNDEVVNTKIRRIQNELLEMEKNKNK